MSDSTTIKKSTSIRLNAGLYSYIEKVAKEENRSVNNYIETLLLNATQYKTPNKETEQAIKQARSERKNLKRYTNAKSVIKKIK